jgi:TPR repeat protein
MLLMWIVSTTAVAAVPKAQAFWDAGDYRQAVAAAFEPANAGDPQAQFLLGEAYRLGRSVGQDLLQARDWYLRAARQGDSPSAAALGELLLNMRRSSEAVPWLTLAASHNHARATALLAAVYYTGDGADKDLILATSLMKKAAAEGSPEAKAKLALMDDTAPPVDVSSPAASPIEFSDASTNPAPAPAPARPTAPLIERSAFAAPVAHSRRAYGLGIQVGAFRSAANARRAAGLMAEHMSGTHYRTTVLRSGGFFKVLVIAEDRRSESLARARLVRIGWQHFARRSKLLHV